ncbi:MAG: hypothetical protein V4695_00905 [Pseudomonadota bacterium]
MHPLRTHASLRSFGLILFFALALLATQWIGVMHRVAHSGLIQVGESVVASQFSHELPTTQIRSVQHLTSWEALFQEGSETLSHSCEAFDAATLAFALVPTPIVMPAIAAQFDIDQRTAFRSWSVPFFPCFSSRAPPAG